MLLMRNQGDLGLKGVIQDGKERPWQRKEEMRRRLPQLGGRFSFSAVFLPFTMLFFATERCPSYPLLLGAHPHAVCSLRLQLVLDSQKRVFSWGFGGYGRLGHAEQKDEMVPRLVKLFDFPGRGASQIYAGYTCSFAVSEVG